MIIKSITVGGFKNLKTTRINLDNVTAIVSPNNYGKSNLLEAIDFATDFLTYSPKDRNFMMSWIRGIPINKSIANNEFHFEIEFENPTLLEYKYIRYGFKFEWYRDDGTGQRITDEWIDARPNESSKYTSFLKRQEGKYKKSKDTTGFRKLNLSSNQLAIDVLSAIDDIDIHPVIESIKSIDYHVCSSLDLRDRFISEPVEYFDKSDEGSISFDDEDVPRALYLLKQNFPEKFNIFLEAVYTLFPEFSDLSVVPYELRKENANIKIFTAAADEKNGMNVQQADDDIPFRIKHELYKIMVTDRYLNQPIDISLMSTGTKRIFWLLANVFIANSKNISLIGIEELETSIHPKLLKSLLEILNDELENTSIIISSHSPYLIQYIKPEKVYVGAPTTDGTAVFKKVKPSKIKNLINSARDIGMAAGEYLFELMSGDDDASQILSFYLEE